MQSFSLSLSPHLKQLVLKKTIKEIPIHGSFWINNRCGRSLIFDILLTFWLV